MIDRIHKHGFIGLDLHLTNFDNRQIGLAYIIKNYLKEINIGVDNNFCNFEKSIKNLANIHNKMTIIEVNYYKPKTKTEYDDKKRVVSILKEIRKPMFDLYTHHESIIKLTEKYQPRRLDKVLTEY